MNADPTDDTTDTPTPDEATFTRDELIRISWALPDAIRGRVPLVPDPDQPGGMKRDMTRDEKGFLWDAYLDLIKRVNAAIAAYDALDPAPPCPCCGVWQ